MENTEKKIALAQSWPDRLKENSSWLVIFSVFVLLTTKAAFNVAMVYMAIAGTYLFFRYRYVFINNPSYRYLIILFCSIWIPMALSLTDAVEFDHSLKKVSAHLGLLFVGLYVVYVGYDIKKMDRLQKAVCYLALFWVGDALIQLIFGRNLVGFDYDNRLTGMFSPRQVIGLILACLSPLVFEWTRLNYVRSKWVFIAPVLIIAVIIIAANRTSWIMLSFSLLSYSIYMVHFIGFKRTLKLVGFSLVGLALVFVIAYQMPNTKNYIDSTARVFAFDYDKFEAASGDRLAAWITAYNMGSAHWINGVGPRGFRYAYKDYRGERDPWQKKVESGEYGYPIAHPHQSGLEVFSETGGIGLLGFGILLYLLFHIMIRCIREKYYKPIPWLIAALVAYNPINTHMALYGNYWSTFSWILLIIAVSSYREFKVTKNA